MDLKKKIENRSANIGVIGLGYVGLPLAMEFVRAGFKVTGIDVNTEKVDMINAGNNYIQDVSDNALASAVSDGNLNATTDFFNVILFGHDGHSGFSTEDFSIIKQNLQVGETYVWNDKFSFNGYEPSGTNVFTAAEQILIAAQGGSTAQFLQVTVTHATDDFDVCITYLDQDWS